MTSLRLFRSGLIAVVAFVAAALGSLAPAQAQERVLSLGGDITEIIYALGAEDRLVATDDASLFPEPARALPKVGYLRRLSAEGVLSVEPDLVLISGAAGPQTALDQIAATGIPIVSIETEYTADIILQKIDLVSQALGLETEGKAFRSTIERDIAMANAKVEALNTQPSVLFFAARPDGAPRAAGDDTAAAGLIDMLGGTNVLAGQTGYTSLSLDAAVAADPDVILVMTHHAARIGGVEGVRKHPALALTTAAKEGRVFAVDLATVMQFGPRTPNAVADLAEDIAETLGD